MTTLKVLGAGPVKRGVTLLAEQFGKAHGLEVSVEFTGAPSVRERVLAGEAVDVAVVPQATMDEFAQQGRIIAATCGQVGRSRMGIVVRKGAPLPAIPAVDDFKQAMMSADEIVCNVASSGQYMVRLLEKLGLAPATKDKVLTLPNAVKVMEHVAGSAALAIGAGQLAEISELIDKGLAIALVAPLPDEIQNVTAYSAAVAEASDAKDAAAAFAAFLTGPEAKPVFAATGID